MCLPYECSWASAEPRLTAPKPGPLCRLRASTQQVPRSADSKEDNSGQIRKGEKHEIDHPTSASHLLQATATPEVSLCHQTAKHFPSLPLQAIPHKLAVSVTQSYFQESLTECVTHFTVVSQKLALFHGFVILSQMLLYLLLPPPPLSP